MNDEAPFPFIRLARKFFRSDLWNEPREFSRAEAWLDMIATATFAPETRMVEGRCVSLQRGELVASLRYLACRWSWSKSKVERYLGTLVDAGRATYRDANGTGMRRIALCNYDAYNPTRDELGTDTSPPAGQSRDKVKEVEEGKKLKNVYKRFEKPSREELDLAATKLGLPSAEVERFFNFYESKGWKVGNSPMRSWTHALTNWKLNWESGRYANTRNDRNRFISDHGPGGNKATRVLAARKAQAEANPNP